MAVLHILIAILDLRGGGENAFSRDLDSQGHFCSNGIFFENRVHYDKEKSEKDPCENRNRGPLKVLGIFFPVYH